MELWSGIALQRMKVYMMDCEAYDVQKQLENFHISMEV